MDLQRDAAEAVALGMKEINAVLVKRSRSGPPPEEPQVALICMDPHTGEVKALIGGRNYGVSQLNHAVAKRPSGSAFKPFVYAAALNTGLQDRPDAITSSTLFSDDAHTFYYGGKAYEPTDYHKQESLGQVTVRTAFAKSLNIPAVEIAEAVGYNTVANLARQAGLTDVRPTPAMALGAYDVTPLDMTAAYTLFANNGEFVKPRFLTEIMDGLGTEIWSSKPDTKQVLDPRVNFLVVSLMQEVLRSGTGAGVRARGFTLPAAGKTGTEHDAWFAGFTSKLLCVVWVGMDDYQDLKMEGAKAALPIWAEFMRRAHKHRAYRDVSDFKPPDGVVSVQVDMETGLLATSACPQKQLRDEYFLVGRQPSAFCPLHSSGTTQIAGWESPTPMHGP
jgi:penicillin-binding protein 1B